MKRKGAFNVSIKWTTLLILILVGISLIYQGNLFTGLIVLGISFGFIYLALKT